MLPPALCLETVGSSPARDSWIRLGHPSSPSATAAPLSPSLCWLVASAVQLRTGPRLLLVRTSRVPVGVWPLMRVEASERDYAAD